MPGTYFLSSLDNGDTQMTSPPPSALHLTHRDLITSLEYSFEHINFLFKTPPWLRRSRRMESKFLSPYSLINH